MTRGPAPEVGSSANSYEILAKLAMGGMAEIFLARGQSSAGVERYVVLKRILRHRAQDVHFVRMFLDEARLAAQLQHPNIAQVYDIGKLGDSYFFTMEYVHGETVRTLLARSHGLRRRIPVGSVLSIIAGAAAGLHHAHERKGIDGKPLGIVHRDVSPSNLMVSYEGTVKVVDFGVAKAAHRSQETQSGTVKGKISYMSPEQCKGGEIDRRSDLFSLGIVMWEMLTTERLFRRNSDFENMQAIVAEDVPQPSRLRPDVPPEVDAIVMRLLAKNTPERFQNADEVHEAVEGAAVRTGSALSASSLGRYMRELFGQRPEPWIEMQTNQDAHPDVFTVTSEPIPGELIITPEDELEGKLNSMPALHKRAQTAQPTTQHTPSTPSTSGPVVVGVPTLPLRVQADPDLAKTLLQEKVSPADVALTMQRPKNVLEMHETFKQAPPQAPTVPMMAAPPTTNPGYPMRPHSPSVTPQSSPNYPMVSTASHHNLSQMSNLGYMQAALPAPPRKRSLALFILVPAVVIGVVIGIAVGVGGDDKKIAPLAVPEEEVKEGDVVGMAEDPVNAPGSNAEASGGAVAQPAENPTPDKPVVPETTPDTKPATPDTKPATNDTKPATNDTKPATNDTKPDKPAKPDKPDTKPDKPDTKPDKPDTKPDKKPTLPVKKPDPKPTTPSVNDLYANFSFAEVVTACNASSKVVASNATTCTLAACKVKEASKAKRWLASVASAKKDAVVKECGGVIPIAKPAQNDECKKPGADPLACQH